MPWHVKVILAVGGIVVAAAAAWASFKTLTELAAATQWGDGAWLLPTSIDVLGALACYVWLTRVFPADARRFARSITFVAIGASVVGNGVGHLVSSGKLSSSVLLIVLVGAVPPSSLAALIHLIVLATSTPVPAAKHARKSTEPAKTDARIVPGPDKPKPKPDPKPASAPKATSSPVKPGPEASPAVDELLVRKAKHLDQQHQQTHGKPISRDKARQELGVSNEKAGEALRLAREEGVA